MNPGWYKPTEQGRHSPSIPAVEPPPFPVRTAELPLESGFADWRQRLERNLARASDTRWEPLTFVHARDEK